VKHPEKVTTPPKKRARRELDELEIQWARKDTEETHLLLAKALLECALPFAIVEHPAIVALFEKVNPSYKLPSSKTISTKYVDEVFENTTVLVKQQMKNSKVVLTVDQSADGAGDPIAHVVAIPPQGVPFLC